MKLSDFPSISSILEDAGLKSLIEEWSFQLVSVEVKRLAAEWKKKIRKGTRVPSREEMVSEVIHLFAKYDADLMQPVINGTGVILHTNLGRAPIFVDSYNQLRDTVCGYSNLEFDIAENKRSKRGVMVGRLIAALAGSEAGMIVNNNAASVYMIVANLSTGREVIISRGQLIQIGGGFRIPEIIERSGAILREIGTTNKTSISDYRKATTKNTGLILIVHKSNFVQRGFAEEPEPSRIVELAKKKRIPVCYDLGSGMPPRGINTELMDEPDIGYGIRTGADLVCFSGDKLMGGPQAGLIVGKRKYISSLLKDPLYRVMRPDKLTIGLMEKTLRKMLAGKMDNPCWSMATCSFDALEKRANRIVSAVDNPAVKALNLKSSFGGGSFPEYEFPSHGIKISGKPSSLSLKLRSFSTPVISRSIPSGVLIDLRTVFPYQDSTLIDAIKSCL